ncbi:hypothetical protein [uncultured Desulfuromusa sp.]|nr:hypothetical protein [uncultured Desulfuromusa sp.]
MKKNSEVDFSISKEDMETLKSMEEIKDYSESGKLPIYGGKLK